MSWCQYSSRVLIINNWGGKRTIDIHFLVGEFHHLDINFLLLPYRLLFRSIPMSLAAVLDLTCLLNILFINGEEDISRSYLPITSIVCVSHAFIARWLHALWSAPYLLITSIVCVSHAFIARWLQALWSAPKRTLLSAHWDGDIGSSHSAYGEKPRHADIIPPCADDALRGVDRLSC